MGGGGGIGKTLGTIGGGAAGFVLSGGNPLGAAAGSMAGGALGGLLEGPQSANTGGAGGVDDLRAGLQDQSNEIWSGMGPTKEVRQQRQQKFAEQLYNQATGAAPSLAQAQLKAAQDRNLAQQMAAIKANRAVNPALAQRQVSRLGAEQAQQTAQAGAIAAMQERERAQQQFASYLGQQQQLAANTRAQALSGAVQSQQIAAQNAANQNQFAGNLLSTAGQLGASYLTAQGKKAAHGAYIQGPEHVKGDSEKNDVVPAMLSAGEIVVPKTVVQQGPEAIKSFAQALLEKHAEPKKMNKGGMVKAKDFKGALASKYSKKGC